MDELWVTLELERLLRRSGLPPPVRQFEVRRQETLIGRVDLTYPERRLALEADGYRYHSGRAAWGRDLARGNGLLLAGWRVLRFTSADLRQRPDDVVEAVRRAHAESF